MSQAYDSKKSLDIKQFSRDQQNKSVEEYQLAMINILNTLSSKEKQDLIITLLGSLAKESKQLPNNHQVTVSNPTNVSTIATEETLSELSSNTENRINSNIDIASDDYYYFLSYLKKTTQWRIKRMSKTTYAVDFVEGDSDVATAWTDRESKTYSLTI